MIVPSNLETLPSPPVHEAFPRPPLLRPRMSDEKFDGQDNLGSKEPAAYTPRSTEGDVEEGGPKPLMMALESQDMQMIAIASPSLLAPPPQGNLEKEQAI
jgi:hypothetical protein